MHVFIELLGPEPHARASDGIQALQARLGIGVIKILLITLDSMITAP